MSKVTVKKLVVAADVVVGDRILMFTSNGMPIGFREFGSSRDGFIRLWSSDLIVTKISSGYDDGIVARRSNGDLQVCRLTDSRVRCDRFVYEIQRDMDFVAAQLKDTRIDDPGFRFYAFSEYTAKQLGEKTPVDIESYNHYSHLHGQSQSVWGVVERRLLKSESQSTASAWISTSRGVLVPASKIRVGDRFLRWTSGDEDGSVERFERVAIRLQGVIVGLQHSRYKDRFDAKMDSGFTDHYPCREGVFEIERRDTASTITPIVPPCVWTPDDQRSLVLLENRIMRSDTSASSRRQMSLAEQALWSKRLTVLKNEKIERDRLQVTCQSQWSLDAEDQ